jgi:integrase
VDGKQVVQSMTWKPEENMTAKQIEKELNRQAILFEQDCKKGQVTSLQQTRLFVKWNGVPMHVNTPYDWLEVFCQRNGLPFYGIHHYRHLFASLLFRGGLDVVSVSGALGHANPNVTLGVYSHFFNETQDRIVDTISNALNFTQSGKK